LLTAVWHNGGLSASNDSFVSGSSSLLRLNILLKIRHFANIGNIMRNMYCMNKTIAIIFLLTFLFSGCRPINLHSTRNIKLKQKPFNKYIAFDLSKVTIYMDSKELVKDLKKRKDKTSDKILDLIAKSDTISYSVCDSIYQSRYNNKYLTKSLRKGQVIIVEKSDGSIVKDIKRKWTNNECNWGYGYFLPGDSTNFFLHIYKLCRF
jgi:hypothetical protein